MVLFEVGGLLPPQHGVGQVQQANVVFAVADIYRCSHPIAAADGQGTRSIRDRAILALGLAAALRRSELVALEWRDVDLVDKGLKLTLRHSKTRKVRVR